MPAARAQRRPGRERHDPTEKIERADQIGAGEIDALAHVGDQRGGVPERSPLVVEKSACRRELVRSYPDCAHPAVLRNRLSARCQPVCIGRWLVLGKHGVAVYAAGSDIDRN